MVSPPAGAAIATPAAPAQAVHRTATASARRRVAEPISATLLPVPGITNSAIPLSARPIGPVPSRRAARLWSLDDRLRSAARPGARTRACGRRTAEDLLRVARLSEGAGRFRAHHHAAQGGRIRAG